MRADVSRCKVLLAQVRSTADEPIVIDCHHDEWSFMWGLLQRHPDRERKAGCGVRHFLIVYSSVDGYPPSSHFEIARIDGSRTDFSYKKCCNSRAPLTAGNGSSSRGASSRQVSATPITAANSGLPGNAGMHAQNFSNNTGLVTSRPITAAAAAAPAPAGPASGSSTFSQGARRHAPSRYYQALRVAVDQQMRNFKRRALRNRTTTVCPITGECLNWDNSQVDHGDLSFKELVNDWLAEEGIALTDVVMESADNTASNKRVHTEL